MMTQTAPQALRSVAPGSYVHASPYCATPLTLLDSLGAQARLTPGLNLSAGMLIGDTTFYDAVTEGHLSFRTWHVAGRGRTLAARGLLDYVPARAGAVESLFASGVDVALVRVSPPDGNGLCSLGPSASYSKAMISSARLVIAEVDPEFPRTIGTDVTIEASRIDHFIEADRMMSTVPSVAPSPEATTIAHRVAALIPSGACLQLGLGAIPEAVASVLAHSDVSNLRLVGLLTDATIGLLRSGRISEAPGAVTAVELIGTRELFTLAHDNPQIQMASSQTVHNPLWLAQQSGLISVCSALEVDLTGQVVSEEVAGRPLAGIGGSVDFFEGAHLSAGGVRIVALPSRTRTGASRIRHRLDPGTPVTLPRHSVDVVITEHGVAHLSGLSIRERMKALLAIADPSHRDELTGHT